MHWANLSLVQSETCNFESSSQCFFYSLSLNDMNESMNWIVIERLMLTYFDGFIIQFTALAMNSSKGLTNTGCCDNSKNQFFVNRQCNWNGYQWVAMHKIHSSINRIYDPGRFTWELFNFSIGSDGFFSNEFMIRISRAKFRTCDFDKLFFCILINLPKTFNKQIFHSLVSFSD